ncbi:hypothetical protein BpHYR1_054552 [Brachionus plicatilis]|uniref:Uncharacterized protein n=1 Tax=Brachionus plicatilis TaxID=10195 RepID=A0A3M7SFF0_BRAPC|nr:hypothetical protein BpHYR1_054552 [Brachionus plicatilis]
MTCQVKLKIINLLILSNCDMKTKYKNKKLFHIALNISQLYLKSLNGPLREKNGLKRVFILESDKFRHNNPLALLNSTLFRTNKKLSTKLVAIAAVAKRLVDKFGVVLVLTAKSLTHKRKKKRKFFVQMK